MTLEQARQKVAGEMGNVTKSNRKRIAIQIGVFVFGVIGMLIFAESGIPGIIFAVIAIIVWVLFWNLIYRKKGTPIPINPANVRIFKIYCVLYTVIPGGEDPDSHMVRLSNYDMHFPPEIRVDEYKEWEEEMYENHFEGVRSQADLYLVQYLLNNKVSNYYYGPDCYLKDLDCYDDTRGILLAKGLYLGDRH